jgi:hypothetical protein
MINPILSKKLRIIARLFCFYCKGLRVSLIYMRGSLPPYPPQQIKEMSRVLQKEHSKSKFADYIIITGSNSV